MKMLTIVISIVLGILLIHYAVTTEGVQVAESVLGGGLFGYGIGILLFE